MKCDRDAARDNEKCGATAYGQGESPHEETCSRSIAQRDLFRRASFQEEGEISCDKGKKSQPVKD
jgi:hypothetical protein